METPIKMIVGLGNPGLEYIKTRHNAGFWFIDGIISEGAKTLRYESKFQANLAQMQLANYNIWLVQPQTYMNKSGLTVLALAKFYKMLPEEILVVHDDLDLPIGHVKLKQGGGHGGHNGLKDIQSHLGSLHFWRLRIGIGRPNEKSAVTHYVLHPARKEEQAAIDAGLNRAYHVLPDIVSGRVNEAIKHLHTMNPK